MKHYLIDKTIYNSMKNMLDGLIFRQEYNETHHKIKFFAVKFENMFKTHLKEKFDTVFQIIE